MITECLYSGLVRPHLEYYVLFRAAQLSGALGLGGFSSVGVNTCREGVKKMEPGSLHWCQVTGGRGHRLKHGRLPLKIRKQYFVWLFFTVMVTEHWHRLAREAVESSCMKRLKSCLDVVLGSLL